MRPEIRLRTALRTTLLCGLLLGTACQVRSDNPPSPSALPTPGENRMTPSPSIPAAPGLPALIEKAKADLAQRLTIPVDEIVLLEASSVTWPDASLGCPREGMAYAQVLTPGYLIRLQFQEREFEYHAGRRTTIAYCENPTPPVPGEPGDT